MDSAGPAFGAAPLRRDIAQGPEGGKAFRILTSDGVGLRLVHWPARPGTSPLGTVFVLEGSSEYAEKYGPTAEVLTRRGIAVVVLDWRGQGLSERPRDSAHLPSKLCHIGDFDEYQHDLAALVQAARTMPLPRPWLLAGHSMAGEIALRGLATGTQPFDACLFTAPMWNLPVPRGMNALALGLARAIRKSHLAETSLPGMGRLPYVLASRFESNRLTSDPGMWAFLQRQAQAAPELVQAGPSFGWIAEGLIACAHDTALASPDLPCVTFLGTQETLVSVRAIRDRMARWPGGRLEIVEGAKHELLLERPEIRARVHQAICDLLGRTR